MAELRKQLENFNREMIRQQIVQNEQIHELLERAFTSKREGRDISPVVKQRLKKLEKVLLKYEDRNQELLKRIAELLHNAVLLTDHDIKAAIEESERHNNTIFKKILRIFSSSARRSSPSPTRRRSPSATSRRSPSATSGGRKTRKNRGKKQKTQKRKHHNKRRKQTQRRKQHKKK
jgi:tetrahydrodipicolinate N-succinyltransferase